MPKKHISWVDGAKGVAILSVVLGHIATPLTNFIFSWHMPIFFFLSGFFLKKPDNYASVFFKDVKKLMFPYFVFAFIGLVAEIIKRRLFPDYGFITPKINLIEELKGIFIWMDITKMHTYGFVLWFLPALLWSRTLANWLIFKIKRPWLVVVISFIIYALTINKPAVFPLALDNGLLVTIWVVLGYYSNNNLEKVKSHVLNSFALIAFVALLFSPIPMLNIAFKTGSNPAYNLVYSLMVILAVLIGCRAIGNSPSLKWLRYFGIGSLTVFVIHPYTNNLAYIVINNYYPGRWIMEFILSIIVLTVVLFTQNNVINRYEKIK